MCDCRVDRVLGDVATNSHIVIVLRITLKRSSLLLHLVCRLPRSRDDLPDSSHRLRIRTHHTENAHVVKHILRRDRLRSNTGICKCNILRNVFIEMVANHQHIEMLIERILRKWHCRICRGRKHIRSGSCADDIRGMTATCALGMIGVDCSPINRSERILNASTLVQRIRMNCDLNIILVCDIETMVDDCRCCTPVLMNLESHRACLDLLDQRCLIRTVSFSEKTEIHRILLRRLEHSRKIPRSRCARRRICTVCRSGSSSDHRRHARKQRAVNLLRTDEMNVRVDSARSHNHPLGCESFCRSADRHSRCDSIHDIRIARFSDADNLSVLNSDVRLVDSRVIHNQRICQHQIEISVRTRRLHRLTHAIADRLSTTELDLISVARHIVFHPRNQIGICKPNPISGCWTVHHAVLFSTDFETHLASPPCLCI